MNNYKELNNNNIKRIFYRKKILIKIRIMRVRKIFYLLNIISTYFNNKCKIDSSKKHFF